MLAVPPTSNLVSMVPPELMPKLPDESDALAPNVHLPVIVSFCESDAGPPAPQSRFIIVSEVPEAVRVNLPRSKFSTLEIACTVAPPSSVFTAAVAQPNLPVALSHWRKFALAQFAKPEP